MKTQKYLLEIKSNEPLKLDWSKEIVEELKYAFRDMKLKVIKLETHLKSMKKRKVKTKLKGGKKNKRTK
jgi:hypothetical protein